MSELNTPDEPSSSETKYFLLVGGLLLAVIILLAALWMRERKALVAVQKELVAARRNLATGGKLQAALGSFLGARRPEDRPLSREDLPLDTVDWDGRPRQILRISAAAGERIGLLPGDVVEVAQPPATAPASAPAE